jgi:hypothetical protein
MEFRSRIFADSQGQTIDAIGHGRFLVCHQNSCVTVNGWRQAQLSLKQQDSPAN